MNLSWLGLALDRLTQHLSHFFPRNGPRGRKIWRISRRAKLMRHHDQHGVLALSHLGLELETEPVI